MGVVKSKCVECGATFFTVDPVNNRKCSDCTGDGAIARAASAERDAALINTTRKVTADKPQSVDPRTGQNPEHTQAKAKRPRRRKAAKTEGSTDG